MAALANTTLTNLSTGSLNASGLASLLNTTATNISAAVLIASTGITSSSIRTDHLNIGSTTIPFINTNTSNINITTNNLRLTQAGVPLFHYTAITSASYMTYQQNSGAVRGMIGLDGVGYSGALNGSFAISTWTAHPMNFFTNSLNRMTINSSGNIGIGTTSPSYPLEVNGGIKTTGMTAGNINLSGGNLILRNTGHTTGLSFGDNNNTAAFSKIYDDAQLNIWSDDNMYFDIGATFASASNELFINSSGVGIGGTTSPLYNLSINTATDSPGINPDAYNSLLVYEDMQSTTVRSGTLSGTASYIQNTGGTTGYVQLSPDNGGVGSWEWNMNPGNSFTVDYEVQAPGTADGHQFFWGLNSARTIDYRIHFDEWNDQIRLYYAGAQLAIASVAMGSSTNWFKVRIVFQRNVIKVYHNGKLYINYKDTARHANYESSITGFTCWGNNSAHRIRELRIQKFTEGVWGYTSQTSANIMFHGGYVGIGTQTPTSVLHVVQHNSRGITLDGSDTYTNFGIKNTGTNGRSWLLGSQNNGSFYIFDDTAGAFRYVITPSGTGIGTVSPGYMLDTYNGIINVNSGAVTDGNLILTNNNGGGVINFQDPHHAIYGRRGASNEDNKLQIREYGDIEFWNGGLITSQSKRLTVAKAGNVIVAGALSKGSGSFDIPHPLATDPKQRLVHSFVEGPRCDLIYRGITQLQNGMATVNIDNECTQNTIGNMTQGTFQALCTNPVKYVYNNDSFDNVRGAISGNILTITCENPNSSDSVEWIVIAERKDDFIKQWDKTDESGLLITQYTETTNVPLYTSPDIVL